MFQLEAIRTVKTIRWPITNWEAAVTQRHKWVLFSILCFGQQKFLKNKIQLYNSYFFRRGDSFRDKEQNSPISPRHTDTLCPLLCSTHLRSSYLSFALLSFSIFFCIFGFSNPARHYALWIEVDVGRQRLASLNAALSQQVPVMNRGRIHPHGDSGPNLTIFVFSCVEAQPGSV